MPTTTAADIDKAKTSLDNIQNQVDELNAKLKGGSFDTALDAIASVKGDFLHKIIDWKILKVEGGYTKVQVGVSNQIVLGFKGEFVKPYSISIVLGMETKTIVGFSDSLIHGSKSDTIIGAKVDLLGGIKYEKKADTTQNYGASPKLELQGKVLNKMDRLNQMVGSFVMKATKVLIKSVEVQETINSLAKKVDELDKKHAEAKETISSLSQKLGTHKMKGTTLTYEFANIGITGGSGFQVRGSGSLLNLNPGQPAIEGGGSYVAPHNSGVSFKGSTHRFV